MAGQVRSGDGRDCLLHWEKLQPQVMMGILRRAHLMVLMLIIRIRVSREG